MARINYFEIQEAIRDALIADKTLDGVLITIEEDGPKSGEQMPWVGIYLAGRDDEGESMAAGTRQLFKVRYEIWCFEHNLESVKLAAQARDDLISRVENALMKDRLLRMTSEGLKIVSGEFEKASDAAGFMMGGSIIIEVLKTATTL